MALTQAQRRKIARRTTPTSKARLRARYQGQAKPARPRAKTPQINPLLDPSRALSGPQLQHAANLLTNLEFGSQQNALKRSYAQATRQGTALSSRASDYYRQLAGDTAQAVARQSAIGTELQTRLGTAGAQSQQALDQINQEAADRAAQDQAVRGPGLGGGGQDRVAAEVAAARGLAAASAQSAQEQGALSAYNYGNLQNLTGQATGLAGGEAQRDILNGLSAQQADIRGRQNDLSAQVASKRVANLLQLRQQGFENTLAARGVGVDLARIRADIANSKRNARLADKRIRSAEHQNAARLRTTRRGQDISARQQELNRQSRERLGAADRASRERIAASRKHGTRLESSDARKVRFGIANALADIQSKKPKDPAKWLRKQGAPGIVIKAAIERSNGGISPATYRELRRMGVKIPKGWKIRPSQTPIIGGILGALGG